MEAAYHHPAITELLLELLTQITISTPSSSRTNVVVIDDVKRHIERRFKIMWV